MCTLIMDCEYVFLYSVEDPMYHLVSIPTPMSSDPPCAKPVCQFQTPMVHSSPDSNSRNAIRCDDRPHPNQMNGCRRFSTSIYETGYEVQLSLTYIPMEISACVCYPEQRPPSVGIASTVNQQKVHRDRLRIRHSCLALSHR